ATMRIALLRAFPLNSSYYVRRSEVPMSLSRRSFVASAGLASATAAVAGALPFPRLTRSVPEVALPPAALFQQDEERYWAEIRRQFLIPADEVYLNNGTVGSSPRPVLNAVFEGYN